MASKTAPSKAESEYVSVGPLLRAAREKQDISLKEIATQLNLHSDIVDALEQDNHELLPAAIYVRGYIRSYSKLLKLDGDELIAAYDQGASGPPEIIPDIKQHAQASSNDKPVKAVTYLVTFCLLLLLIAWLQSKYVVQNSTQKAAPATHDTVVEKPEPAPYVPVYPEEVYRKTHPEAATKTAPVESSSASSTENNQPTPASTETSATDQYAESQPAETSMQGPDQLELRVSKDSWVDIKDSDGKKIYLGLAQAGADIKLSGTAPFDVLLGYSLGVEVWFNGARFDTQPFSSNGVARFTLETNSTAE